MPSSWPPRCGSSIGFQPMCPADAAQRPHTGRMVLSEKPLAAKKGGFWAQGVVKRAANHELGAERMLGQRPPAQEQLFCYLPEVPRTRLAERLEEVEQVFDWEAVRARAEAYFAVGVGRPSLDPVVVVKLVLLHKLTGSRSWRGLVEFASDSLACRRFLGYEWEERLPSHQALSDWRERLGAEFFEDLLVDVVLHCVREGMELSRVRVVDATAVRAQAGCGGPVVELSTEVSEVEAWLAAAEVEEEPAEPVWGPREVPGPEGERAKPGGTRKVNEHDPEARLSRKPGQPRAFCYQVSFCTDPHSQLVVSTVVKGTEEPGTMAEHVDLDVGPVEVMIADAHYDSTGALGELCERGVQAVVPLQERRRHAGYRQGQFYYDGEGDYFVCPAGKVLRRVGVDLDGKRSYRAGAGVCQGCRRRAWCTTGKQRNLSRQAGAEERERTIRSGGWYEECQGLRRQQEHVWLLAKRDHGMRRADGLGLTAMRISAAMVAICINLGKLRRWRTKPVGAGTAGVQARAVMGRAMEGLWGWMGATQAGSGLPQGRAAPIGRRRRCWG